MGGSQEAGKKHIFFSKSQISTYQPNAINSPSRRATNLDRKGDIFPRRRPTSHYSGWLLKRKGKKQSCRTARQLSSGPTQPGRRRCPGSLLAGRLAKFSGPPGVTSPPISRHCSAETAVSLLQTLFLFSILEGAASFQDLPRRLTHAGLQRAGEGDPLSHTDTRSHPARGCVVSFGKGPVTGGRSSLPLDLWAPG